MLSKDHRPRIHQKPGALSTRNCRFCQLSKPIFERMRTRAAALSAVHPTEQGKQGSKSSKVQEQIKLQQLSLCIVAHDSALLAEMRMRAGNICACCSIA